MAMVTVTAIPTIAVMPTIIPAVTAEITDLLPIAQTADTRGREPVPAVTGLRAHELTAVIAAPVANRDHDDQMTTRTVRDASVILMMSMRDATASVTNVNLNNPVPSEKDLTGIIHFAIAVRATLRLTAHRDRGERAITIPRRAAVAAEVVLPAHRDPAALRDAVAVVDRLGALAVAADPQDAVD